MVDNDERHEQFEPRGSARERVAWAVCASEIAGSGHGGGEGWPCDYHNLTSVKVERFLDSLQEAGVILTVRAG